MSDRTLDPLYWIELGVAIPPEGWPWCHQAPNGQASALHRLTQVYIVLRLRLLLVILLGVVSVHCKFYRQLYVNFSTAPWRRKKAMRLEYSSHFEKKHLAVIPNAFTLCVRNQLFGMKSITLAWNGSTPQVSKWHSKLAELRQGYWFKNVPILKVFDMSAHTRMLKDSSARGERHAHMTNAHRFTVLLRNVLFSYEIGSASWCNYLHTWMRAQHSHSSDSRAISLTISADTAQFPRWYVASQRWEWEISLRSQESEFSHACLVLHYDMHIESKLNGRIFKRLLISDLKITGYSSFQTILLTEVARHPGRLLVSELQSIQTSRVHNLVNLILFDF